MFTLHELLMPRIQFGPRQPLPCHRFCGRHKSTSPSPNPTKHAILTPSLALTIVVAQLHFDSLHISTSPPTNSTTSEAPHPCDPIYVIRLSPRRRCTDFYLAVNKLSLTEEALNKKEAAIAQD
jgi:hypothetical protein